MMDKTTKVYEDLMALKAAAALALTFLDRAISFAPALPSDVTDATNALYAALHPDSDDDATQDAIYAGHAPDGDAR